MSYPLVYYNGVNAHPQAVEAQISDSKIYLNSNDDEQSANGCFPLSDVSHNRIEDTLYIYLDASCNQYIQCDINHPFAFLFLTEYKNKKAGWAAKLMRRPIYQLVGLFIILALGLYFFLVNLIPFIGTRIIDVNKEIIIGDKLHEAMLKEARLIGNKIDSTGTIELQAFAEKLHLSNEYPIKLTLIESNIVNAYALPGGNVVVYKGILRKIKSPEELVALLAHESSHINQRHSLRSLLRSTANSILISIVIGDATGISGAVVGNAEALYGLSYSRSLESEADERGMELMQANNVDVSGMQKLMQTLQSEEKITKELSFLSTHPLTKERIAAAVNYSQKHPQEAALSKDLQSAFEKLMASAQ